MRGRSVLAAFLLAAAITACTQPVPGGGGGSEAPPSLAPASVEQPEASSTPYSYPNY